MWGTKHLQIVVGHASIGCFNIIAINSVTVRLVAGWLAEGTESQLSIVLSTIVGSIVIYANSGTVQAKSKTQYNVVSIVGDFIAVDIGSIRLVADIIVADIIITDIVIMDIVDADIVITKVVVANVIVVIADDLVVAIAINVVVAICIGGLCEGGGQGCSNRVGAECSLTWPCAGDAGGGCHGEIGGYGGSGASVCRFSTGVAKNLDSKAVEEGQFCHCKAGIVAILYL